MSTLAASNINANTVTNTTVTSGLNVIANTITTNTVTANVAIPSSGSINFGSSDVTITHSTNKIDIDGGVVDFGSVPSINDMPIGMTFGTVQATTSGTSKDFSIPVGAKRITVLFDGVSTNGASYVTVQIGTGGVATTTGYYSCGTNIFTGSDGSDTSSHTTGFAIRAGAAADTRSGTMTIMNITDNIWIMTYVGYLEGGATANVSGGVVTLADTLNFLRLTTENGTDTFDAGQVNVYYE